jgi:hypothetical protein
VSNGYRKEEKGKTEAEDRQREDGNAFERERQRNAGIVGIEVS